MVFTCDEFEFGCAVAELDDERDISLQRIKLELLVDRMKMGMDFDEETEMLVYNAPDFANALTDLRIVNDYGLRSALKVLLAGSGRTMEISVINKS